MTWRTVRFGDLTLNFDSRRVPIKTHARIAGPTPYYGASGVIDYVEGYTHEGLFLLVSEDGENLRSRTSPIAFLAEGQIWVNNHAHVVQGRPGVADTVYLQYLLESTDVAAYLSGTAQPKLSRSSMDSIELRVPDIDEQRAIAEVLGALDDKITANDRLATTADDWVRALVARMERETDGRRTIGEVASNPRFQARPDEIGADTVYIGLEHVPRRQMWMGDRGTGGGLSSAKFRFAPGDTLFGKLRPYFHKVIRADERGVCSTDILVVRATEREIAGYVHAVVASDAVVAACVAASEGTRMPRTSWKDLAAVEIPWPGDSAARQFGSEVDALAERVAAASRESRTLATLRDTLLPALMAGRLSVKTAEAAVSQAL